MRPSRVPESSEPPQKKTRCCVFLLGGGNCKRKNARKSEPHLFGRGKAKESCAIGTGRDPLFASWQPCQSVRNPILEGMNRDPQGRQAGLIVLGPACRQHAVEVGAGRCAGSPQLRRASNTAGPKASASGHICCSRLRPSPHASIALPWAKTLRVRVDASVALAPCAP